MTRRIVFSVALVLSVLLTGSGAVRADPPPPSMPAAAPWEMAGNAGTNPTTNFLGTTDNRALVFRTNNLERVRIRGDNGYVGFGTFPAEQLHIMGNLRLPPTTSTKGIIKSGTNTLIHTFGTDNFFAGANAGNLTMTGAGNTATGASALRSNTTGPSNTATGWNALRSNTGGSNNTATGMWALYSNTTGGDNTATGRVALVNNTTGFGNTASGEAALASNISGVENTATGRGALFFNQGDFNTASGEATLQFNTSGRSNTATGRRALEANTTGSNNTGLGGHAGVTGDPVNANTTGSNNTFVGHNAGPASPTQLKYATAIGADAVVGADNALVLGSIGVNVGIGTATPQSTLQVASGYLQLPTVGDAGPPAFDCDSDAEAGRMVVQPNFLNLYVCMGISGWVVK